MDRESEYRKIDDTISMVEGGWEFNKEVALNFDSHVRKSIPLYEELQNMTTDIGQWFVHNGSLVYDLGSSTGETIYRLQKKYAAKANVRFIGIDNSAVMVNQAKKKISTDNVEFLCQDLVQTNFLEADLVISLFTMQFLSLPDRMKVVGAIYECLHVGGALIIAEKVLADEGWFDQLWVELYWDFKKRQGLTDDQILQKARSIRGILRPLTLTENINILRETGFNNIDVFLKWYNFASIIAVKMPTVTPQSIEHVSDARLGRSGLPESGIGDEKRRDEKQTTDSW